jgi:hypothetical protein
LRSQFLKSYLSQDYEKYTAYWMVRRYIGKGNHPRELVSSEDEISFVQATPGAIGYIVDAGLKPASTRFRENRSKMATNSQFSGTGVR